MESLPWKNNTSLEAVMMVSDYYSRSLPHILVNHQLKKKATEKSSTGRLCTSVIKLM